jgi:DNA-binding HxlR family transcriptional regulator
MTSEHLERPREQTEPESMLRGPDSVEFALDQIGDRWTFLVLREAFYGVRRFNDFQRNLGAARNLLSERLNRLIANEIFIRRQYSERPVRYEYRLTDKGRDLYNITVALMRWGDRWLTDQPPLHLTHTTDNSDIELVLRCTHCGQTLDARDVSHT